jgi:protein SCO1/2
MKTNTPLSRVLTVAVLVVAVGLGVVAAQRWLKAPPPPPEFRSAALYNEPRPLPNVELATAGDRHGAATTLLQGRWRLVFFGFTHCPAVCPGAMTTLDHVARELARTPDTPQPIVTLISVDPRRDTPELVASYARNFNPAFEGYSGTEAAVDTLASVVGIAVMRGTPDANGDYMVDHTSAVFVFDPQGRVRGILTSPLTVANLVHDYRLMAGAQP